MTDDVGFSGNLLNGFWTDSADIDYILNVFEWTVFITIGDDGSRFTRTNATDTFKLGLTRGVDIKLSCGICNYRRICCDVRNLFDFSIVNLVNDGFFFCFDLEFFPSEVMVTVPIVSVR